MLFLRLLIAAATLVAAASPALSALRRDLEWPDAQRARPQPSARAAFDRSVAEAIARGVQYLEQNATRGPKGTALKSGRRAGQTALILYTILKGGGSPASETALALLHELSVATGLGTYDRGCILMALEAHDPALHRAWIESLTQGLIDTQDTDGTWGYPSGTQDLSNTQYASLGLWAAAKAGIHAEADVWQALAAGTLGYGVRGKGGFGYHRGTKMPTGSMTTAGIGTLALCEQELSLAGRLEPETGENLLAAREDGLGWLASHFAVGANPNGGGHAYYYMYGLERMAAFTGLARIGDHDWYAEGAEWLLGKQSVDGSWSGRHVETCFAILFLQRATSRGRTGLVISGPAVKQGWATEERGAQVRIACKIERGQPQAQVIGLSGRLLSNYVWPDSEGGGLRVQRVVYSVGGVPAAVALGSPGVPSMTPLGAAGVPARLYPTRKGLLVARLYLAAPPGAEELPRFVESPPLDVLLTASSAPLRLQAGTEARLERATCRASTHFAPRSDSEFPQLDFEAGRAVDGAPSFPWLARATDSAPKIKLSSKSSTSAIGVLIAPPTLPGYPEIELRLPTRVRVTLNGRRRSSIACVLSTHGRTTVLFPEPTRVKTIEIEILETVGPQAASTGLGEVSLVVAP